MSNICQLYFGKYIYKIYVKYILNTQLLAKIYFIHFDIYLHIYFFYMWIHAKCSSNSVHITVSNILKSVTFIFYYINSENHVFCLKIIIEFNEIYKNHVEHIEKLELIRKVYPNIYVSLV